MECNEKGYGAYEYSKEPLEVHLVRKKLVKYLKEYCNLNSNTRILEVGSGFGGMANYFIDLNCVYEGFDINKDGVQWCTENITSKHPNFNFRWIDLYNKFYNPDGEIKAKDFVFPYNNDSFDIIFLASVFTHMLPEDVENYFFEISRVLKTDGYIFSTYFLLNLESERFLQDQNRSKYTTRMKRFFKKDPHPIIEFNEGIQVNMISNTYGTTNKDIHEAVIAYKEDYIKDLHNRNGLNIILIGYGSWCGKGVLSSYQDILIAEKVVYDPLIGRPHLSLNSGGNTIIKKFWQFLFGTSAERKVR